jgi:hypothetical protein
MAVGEFAGCVNKSSAVARPRRIGKIALESRLLHGDDGEELRGHHERERQSGQKHVHGPSVRSYAWLIR